MLSSEEVVSQPHSEPDEMQQLVSTHYVGLLRFGYRLSKCPTDAQDLVQQTFLQWARCGEQLRDRSKAKSWLYTTLYREHLRSTRRKKHRERFLQLSDHSATAGPDDRKQDQATALAALTCLEQVFRVTLSLFYLEGMSYKEIAETLGIPIGTVMSRLARGKAQLREYLSVGV